jgi:hypothetical protein
MCCHSVLRDTLAGYGQGQHGIMGTLAHGDVKRQKI